MSALLPDFVPLWTFILALAILFYVLLDGFDLGVGMLYTLAPQPAWRTLIMNSIAPIWDGNETWLVLGGVGLLAAFPLVFAILMPALYFPILLILIGLIFRGVAFEFRRRELTHPGFWDRAFGFGSVLASFAQGIVIGAFIQGFEVEGRHFSGRSFDCFTTFSLFCGFSLALALAQPGRIPSDPLLRRGRTLCAQLRRRGYQPLADGDPSSLHLVGGRIVTEHPDISPRWPGRIVARDPALFGVVLLGISRQSPRRYRL